MNTCEYFIIIDNDKKYFPKPIQDPSAPVPVWRSELILESGKYRLFLKKAIIEDTFQVSITRHALAASKEVVECHTGVETMVHSGNNDFILIPGLFYNGNHAVPSKLIPVLGDGPEGAFEAPLTVASFPVVMALKVNGMLVTLKGPSTTECGPSGFRIERGCDDVHYLSYVVPAMEKKRYRHCSFVQVPRRGAVLEDGDAIRFTYGITRETVAGGVPAIFSRLREETSRHRVKARGQKTETSVAVKVVADRLLAAHYKIISDGGTLFLNAFDEDGPLAFGNKQFPAECLLQTGWCNGSLTAYPLMALGEPYRQPAIDFLDFMASKSLSPAGLAYGLFDGIKFYSRGTNLLDGDQDKWSHIRPSCDFITYTLRAARLESMKGHEHPLWVSAGIRGLKALVDVWNHNHDFGRLVDRESDIPTILEGGSGAGSFALLALLEGVNSCLPEVAVYQLTLEDAAEHYWNTTILKGRSGGGPLDILGVDDSESAAAFAEAFLGIYRLTGKLEWLERARVAADIFASWVYAGDASMPKYSSMEAVSPRGGVIANVQNRHLGPGICVNSGRFLRELAVASGEPDYLALLQDIVSFAVDCVALEDGEFFGYWRGGGVSKAFRKGMISEQVNLGDALNLAGETWVMSFSWPMSALLMAWEELNHAV